MPSSSATIISPALTVTPPQVMGWLSGEIHFFAPGLGITPLAKTGNLFSLVSAISRMTPSITNPLTPRA